MPPQESCIGGKNWPSGICEEALARTADADVALNLVVVGLEVFVAHRPIFAVAVPGGRFEFVVAVAIAFASPAESLAPYLPAANPHEGLVDGEGLRILQVADEELMAVLIAGIAEALYWLVLQQAALIAEAAKFELVRPHVLGEIASRNARRSGFEHQDRQVRARLLLWRPSRRWRPNRSLKRRELSYVEPASGSQSSKD